MIIERTICLVLGPCTALFIPFLKHCTLTNKAVGTIWRALSKPPQRRQGPDLRPLWLLVGTPSAITPELAFSRVEHSLHYLDVTILYFCYIIFIIYAILESILWPLRLGWLLVCLLYKEVYLHFFLYVCRFDYTAVAGSGKVGHVNQVNHTSWVALATPTDRPKSVRNRCLIELLCVVVCDLTLPFWHFCLCRDFCYRTESDLLLFVLIKFVRVRESPAGFEPTPDVLQKLIQSRKMLGLPIQMLKCA